MSYGAKVGSKQRRSTPGSSSPRLSGAELTVYVVVVTAAACKLAWDGYYVSRLFEPGQVMSGSFYLYKGWIPGLRNDLSDIQWRLYRQALPSLTAALALYVTLSRTLSHATAGAVQFSGRHHVFRLIASAAFLIALHGSHALHVLTALSIHYLLCWRTAGKRWLGPAVIWGVPIAIWVLARAADGLPFGAGLLAFLPGRLEDVRGPVRWQIGFNLVMLRMLSWGFDLHWTRLRQRGFAPHFEHSAPPQAYVNTPHSFMTLSAKDRQLFNHTLEWYQAPMYAAYCLYPPLYLTGPTMTFNDFVCQVRKSRRVLTRELVSYGARVALTLLLLEVLTHTLYVNAFARFAVWDAGHGGNRGALFTGPVMAAIAFYKLVFLWLKFTVIWRGARLAALADGIDPPENMLRCVCNNYDISGFWRSWHASFNKWLIRYMYIPLGGSRTRLINVWPIFTFVALWHDLEWRLLKWAWLMALFIAPEVLCRAVIRSPAWLRHWHMRWFTNLCAAFAAVYISVLMAVNLVGYGMGQDAVQHTLAKVLGSAPMLAAMLVSFYCAAQLMFEVRRREEEAATAPIESLAYSQA